MDVNERRRLVHFDYVVRLHGIIMIVIHILLLHGRVSGLRPQGRPRKKRLDGILDDYAALGLSPPDADRLVRDRRTWRSVVCNLGFNA